MCFSFEILSTFGFLLLVSKAITTKIYFNFLDCGRLHVVFFVWYINMILILRTWRVEKSLLEIYRVNVSTDVGGVLKTNFGELKICFLPTAPIQIISYRRNILDYLEVSKHVFHLKYDLHTRSSYLFQKLAPPKFRSTYSNLVGRRQVWCLKK
jgi:hypothetical protein